MKTIIYTLSENRDHNKAGYLQAAEILKQGGLVAFPTETVYGLGGNGLNPDASMKIYEAKGRPSDNPLILHIADREQLVPLVKEIPEMAEKLMERFWPGPMTLIFEKSDLVPHRTTGGLDTVAIRMPSHPVARALIRAANVPVAAPSANRSGRPSCTTAEHCIEDLDGRVDMILDGGSVEIGIESTIIDCTGDVPMILRPGFISREDVEELLGVCEIDPAILKKPDADFRPKAPGMKYRHYAPKASLTIVEGGTEAAIAEILRLVEEGRAQGLQVGILCTEESLAFFEEKELPHIRCIGLRASEESIAHNLFRCLREFDEEEVDTIYSESYGDGPLGAAIMNRLVKAAGYHIIHADE